MKPRLSLAHKQLLLVALPLLVQLLMLAGVARLELEAESVVEQGMRAHQISAEFDELVKNYLELSENLQAEREQGLDITYYIEKKRLQATFARLKSLLSRGRPVAVLDRMETTLAEASKLIEAIDAERKANPKFHPAANLRKELRKRKELLAELVASEFVPLQREQKNIAEAATALQSKTRSDIRSVLICTALFNILAAMGVAFAMNKSIARRISAISDNSVRLASGMPLKPALPGGDEIARLDLTFHEMAAALAQAETREKLVLSTARDLICTLDSRCVFTSSNPAALDLLGYSVDELVGQKLANLLAQDSHDVLNCLKLITQGENLSPLDVRLVTKGGITVDVVCSAHWSQEQHSLFCIMHNITERKAAERLRRDVMHMVSHDLRTPLSSIRATLELLESGRVGDISERAQQLIQMADRSSGRMLMLINDLLDIEKMESGMLVLDKAPVSITSLFEECCCTASPLASEKKVELCFEPNSACILVDSFRIHQVLVNLLSNAIKFSPQNSKIRLVSNMVPGWTEISVIDQGRGIPEELIDKIFDRFRQVKESDAKAHSGSGLGLAICKALVELHGGNIFATSVPNKGSTFTFRIPDARIGESSPGSPQQSQMRTV